MSTRACGPCRACCQGWLVAEIDGQALRPGTGCRHLTGSGCGIYPDRPHNPCRVFVCGWLRENSPLPEDLRPDLSGAIVMFDRDWQGWQTIRAIPTAETVPEATRDRLMALARETGTPLIFSRHVFENGRFLETKHTGYGPPAFVEAVHHHVFPDDVMSPTS